MNGSCATGSWVPNSSTIKGCRAPSAQDRIWRCVTRFSPLKVVKTCCFWISHSNFGRNCKNRIRKFKSQVLISSPYPWWWNSNQEETRTPHTSSLKRTAFSKSCVRGLLPTRNSLKHVARRVPLVTKSWNCSSSSISLDPYVTHW